jgi:hypothetical protein
LSFNFQKKKGLRFVRVQDILTPGSATNQIDKKQLENSEKHENSEKMLTDNYLTPGKTNNLWLTNAIANAGFACWLKHLKSLHTFVLADS